MTKKDLIEKHFGMNFKNVINFLHWKEQKSIKFLSDTCGVSRDTFQRLARGYNLKLRSIQEATKLTPNKGAKHWAWNLKRPEISERMKKFNPTFNENTKNKIAISRSLYMKKNPYPQEIKVIKILDKYSVKYIFQQSFLSYVIDFFIPSKNTFIEVESKDKWDKLKKQQIMNKYKLIKDEGYDLIRIWRKLSIIDIENILQSNNIITHI